jgi:uncharacterized protein YfcZ (UPF0381/DUF406 family)
MKKILLVLLIFSGCQQEEEPGIAFHHYRMHTVIEQDHLSSFEAYTLFQAQHAREDKLHEYSDAVLINSDPLELQHETVYGPARISQTGNNFTFSISEETFLFTPTLSEDDNQKTYTFESDVVGDHQGVLRILFTAKIYK